MGALKYIALAAGVFIGGKYLLSLKRAKEKILIDVSADRGAISTEGIELKLKYNIKNPTSANLKVTPPLIKLTFNGKQLATSSIKTVDIPQAFKDQDGKIRIKAFKETGEITTSVWLTWLSILSVSSDLVTRLKDKGSKIKIDVETTSQVYTSVGNYPLDDTTTIEV